MKYRNNITSISILNSNVIVNKSSKNELRTFKFSKMTKHTLTFIKTHRLMKIVLIFNFC